jgi:hypothetical protein
VIREPSGSHAPIDEKSSRWFIVSQEIQEAKTYIPALAILALVEAHRVSTSEGFLEGAKNLWTNMASLGDVLYTGDYVGKVALASAALFRETRSPEFLTASTRASDAMRAWQTSGGAVVLRHRFSSVVEQPWATTLDRTSEYVVAMSGLRALLK